MTTPNILFAPLTAGLAGLVLAAAAALPAHATTAGRLGTLERGHYVCEMPGDVAIGRGVPMPDDNFTVTNASTYSSEQGSGTYLRTGDRVIMTSGPKKGERYEVAKEGFVRRVDKQGKPTGLRCIRLGSTAS